MLLGSFSAQFTWVDWLVVVGYLALTTWIGVAMAGKQATIRDFFLGGRKLPWYAVSGSIIATEISALTFVSVPWLVAQPGGNFTYLQLGLFGAILARIFVGYVLVPEYYKREIYSPYDYMGHALGGEVRTMVTALFTVQAMLGQSARIYLTGEVLRVVLADQLNWLSANFGFDPLAWAIIIICGVSLIWTLLGGITTVIWTDVVLFLAFLLGAFVALGVIVAELDGGFAEMFRLGYAAKESGPSGKFTFFNTDFDFTNDLTIWAAIIASTWGGVGSYGIDQLLVQRMFTCKNTRDARWAIISSSVSQIVTITVMLVGVGLYAYYQTHQMSPEAQVLFNEKPDRMLPIFTVEVVPTGLAGVIIAAIFAAAISTVMGVLAALSQTTQTAFIGPIAAKMRRSAPVAGTSSSGGAPAESEPPPGEHDGHSVFTGRVLIIVWAVILGAIAYWTKEIAKSYPTILQLGLAMVQYIIGALIAGFALAFFKLKIDGRGFMYAGPLSAFCIFGLVWHPDTSVPMPSDFAGTLDWLRTSQWPVLVCAIFSVVILAVWFGQLGTAAMGREGHQTLILVAGLAMMFTFTYFAQWPTGAEGKLKSIAWPWLGPIGSVIAFTWGYLLARARPRDNVIT